MHYYELAAASGHVGCLREVRDAPRGWGALACDIAAANGQLKALKWLHAQGHMRDDDVCAFASAHGHVDCLAFAHENGRSLARCRWRDAVARGHTDVVRYGCEHGWTPGRDVMRIAIASNLPGVLDVLSQHMRLTNETSDIRRIAIGSGALACLDYMNNDSIEWNERFCSDAVLFRRADVLAYLHENGCPWNWKACLNLAKKSAAGLCEDYLHDHSLCPYTGPCWRHWKKGTMTPE
jgi:hypothetical protein